MGLNEIDTDGGMTASDNLQHTLSGPMIERKKAVSAFPCTRCGTCLGPRPRPRPTHFAGFVNRNRSRTLRLMENR